MANLSSMPTNFTLSENRNVLIVEEKSFPGNEDSDLTMDDFIYTYICPVFIIVGVIGNVISFITLCRPPLNTFSSSVYLTAFSFAAVLTLAFSLGLDWCYAVIMTDKVHFKTSSDSVCRLWAFFDRMVKCSGVWFIVGGVTDRVIGLWFPYKAQDMCTVFIAKVAVSISLIAVTAVNVHAMWMHDIIQIRYQEFVCDVDSRDSEFKLIWNWTSTILCSLVPQACLFILGNILVLRMCLKHRGRNIPETASIEMDLTYIVMVFAIVYATFSLPSTVTFIIVSTDNSLMASPRFRSFYFCMNYLNWVSYSCLSLVLCARCSAFRESVKGMVVGCFNVIRHGKTTAQMKEDEYEQVPSTSTIL